MNIVDFEDDPVEREYPELQRKAYQTSAPRRPRPLYFTVEYLF